MNTFGYNLRLTTFGESHGKAIGGILDGMPSRIFLDLEDIQTMLSRRAPGNATGATKRKESDKLEILSGISDEGYTLGTPIGFIIRNEDHNSKDYKDIEGKFRPNHADYTYYSKYGIHDFRGGGRSSARETANWVAAGAIVKQWLEKKGICITAKINKTGDYVRALSEGDSVGGVVECSITGVPVGLGSPVFDKLHARLASAMMSINAAKGFEYGDGFNAANLRGSECRDLLSIKEGKVSFSSNHSGGVQGGISNGMPIEFKVYFKPTPTISQPCKTIDINLQEVEINPRGRHDACVAIRAVPVVEAMAWLVIGDLMRERLSENNY